MTRNGTTGYTAEVLYRHTADGAGYCVVHWQAPTGPDWVALPFEHAVIPAEALLTLGGQLPRGLVQQLVSLVATCPASGIYALPSVTPP